MGWLLILPVIYASINDPVAHTAVVAVAALAGALGLMATGNAWGSEGWFRVLFIATFDVMAVASAVNRPAAGAASDRPGAAGYGDPHRASARA